MKYLIFLLVLFSFYLVTISQDIKDPFPVLNIADTMLLKNPNRFVKGFACANEDDRKLDSALFMNFTHKTIFPDGSFHPLKNWESPEGQIRIQGFQNLGNSETYYSMLQAPAIQFDPAIMFYTDPDFNPQDFTPLLNDTSGRVFGFKNIDLNVGTINGFEYRLDTTGVSSTVTVLSEPWPDNEMIGLFETGDASLNNDTNSNCTRWFLSINLKSLDQITANNENETVLILKVPYYLYNNPTKYYVRFDREPMDGLTSDDTTHIWSVRGNSDYRGLARKLRGKSADSTIIAITGKMLKVDSAGTPDTNITISGYFLLNGDTLRHNHRLQTSEYKNDTISTRISHLGIEVIYNGKINVAINWLRFETPHARDILRGQVDSLFADTLRYILNYVRGKRDDLRVYKFFGVDEIWVQHYLIHRYFNYLVDGMGISEIDHNTIPAQFEHLVGFNDFWNGTTTYLNYEVAAPYFRRTNRWADSAGGNAFNLLPEVFNYYNGYLGFWTADSSEYLEDTINSNYETYLIHQYQISGLQGPYSYWFLDHVPLPIPDNLNIWENSDYNSPPLPLANFYYCTSPLSVFEKSLYKNFYKKPSFLFSEKPWWYYIWATSDWKSDANGFYLSGKRPLTGEELRYMSSFPIILGAKGLMYWWNVTYPAYEEEIGGCIGITSFGGDSAAHENLPKGMDLLNSDIIGGDFIQFPNDSSQITNYFSANNILWDTLYIPQTRMYVGRRTQRIETYKINSWIEAVEDTLIDLRLTAWYAKGFKSWYVQDPPLPVYVDWKLDHYITHSGIKTRKIWDEVYKTWNSQPENRDSSFFDVTLLRKSSDTGLTSNTVYLGIQNRRTDPLIRTYDTLITGVDSSMKFYSTAEFEDNCGISTDSSRYSADSLWWRSFWWKRLGCREMKISFNYAMSDTFNYEMRLTELGYSDRNLNANFWRKPAYYHLIDTSINKCDSLKVRMLPGEGKVLTLRTIKIEDKSTDTCDICKISSNTEKINIEYESFGTDSTCCWDIYLNNNSFCYLEDIPVNIELITNNNDYANFTPSNWYSSYQEYPVYNLKNFKGSIHARTRVKIGTVCLNDGQTFISKVSFGELVGDALWRCPKIFIDTLTCPSNEKTCCDNVVIELDSLYEPNPVLCCYNVRILQPPDSCPYFGLLVDGFWNNGLDSCEFPGLVIPLDSLPIDFSTYTNKSICFNDSAYFPIMHDLYYLFQFLDSNGNVVCEKKIHMDCHREQSKSIEIIDKLGAEPNPAKDETTIFYDLLESAEISLEIYNFMGVRLYVLEKGKRDKGSYKYLFDTSKLQQGIYSILLTANADYKTVVLLILR